MSLLQSVIIILKSDLTQCSLIFELCTYYNGQIKNVLLRCSVNSRPELNVNLRVYIPPNVIMYLDETYPDINLIDEYSLGRTVYE